MNGFHRRGLGMSAQEIVRTIGKKTANCTLGNNTAQTTRPRPARRASRQATFTLAEGAEGHRKAPLLAGGTQLLCAVNCEYPPISWTGTVHTAADRAHSRASNGRQSRESAAASGNVPPQVHGSKRRRAVGGGGRNMSNDTCRGSRGKRHRAAAPVRSMLLLAALAVLTVAAPAASSAQHAVSAGACSIPKGGAHLGRTHLTSLSVSGISCSIGLA